MSNVNTTENPSYNGFERFLIWFLIPVVFIIVLLFVLYFVLGVDITKKVQSSLHNIPVIGAVIPAPKDEADASDPGKEVETVEKTIQTKDEQIGKLNAQIADLEVKVQQTGQTTSTKEQEAQNLKAKIAALEEQLELKTKTEEEYNQQVQELANVYAKMNPSKAAPILENLTLNETVLVMSMMKTDDRVKVLEKMNPKKAAEASIALKDKTPLRDLEMEALRKRLELNESEKNSKQAEPLSQTDLGQTFGNMTPKSAAALLLEMYTVTPSKVISIITGMDTASRSRIMSALTDQDKDLTAEIALKLGK